MTKGPLITWRTPDLVVTLSAAIFLFASTATLPTATLAYCATMLYGFKSREAAFQALVISCLLTASNPSFSSEAALRVKTIGRWLPFLPAYFHLFRRPLRLNQTSPLILASIILATTVLISSYAPITSLAKLASFSLGVYSICELANSSDKKTLIKTLTLSIWSVVILSCPTLLIPTIGFNRNASGFQGVLVHPQTYGVFAAISACFIYAVRKQLLHKRLADVSLLLLIVSLVLSESRTAVISAGLGLLICHFSQGSVKTPFNVVKPRNVILIPLVLGLTIIMSPVLIKHTENFARKRSQQKEFSTAFTDSRLELLYRGLASFQKSPLTGIGFGLPSSKAEFKRKSSARRTSSVTTEKGNLYIGVLEESGLLGAIALVIIIKWSFSPIIARKQKVEATVPLVFLLTNLGESTLFSIGGIGFWGWLTIAVVRAEHKHE